MVRMNKYDELWQTMERIEARSEWLKRLEADSKGAWQEVAANRAWVVVPGLSFSSRPAQDTGSEFQPLASAFSDRDTCLEDNEGVAISLGQGGKCIGEQGGVNRAQIARQRRRLTLEGKIVVGPEAKADSAADADVEGSSSEVALQ